MDEIAAASGLTKPAVYRVFRSKRALYDAVAEWYIDQTVGDVLVVAAQDLGFDEFLATAVASVVSRVRRDEAVYRFLLRQARIELASADAAGPDYVAMLAERVTPVVADRLAAAGSDPAIAGPLTHAVVGLVNGVAGWSIEQDERSAAMGSAVAASVLARGLRGLTAEG